MRNVAVGGWLFAAASFWAISSAYAQESPPPSEKAKAVVALVERAAALVNAKGKAACAAFRQSDSEWRRGDIYLFVIDLRGVQWCNAGFPKQDGADVSDVKDSNGRLVVMDTIKIAEANGAGWIGYMWPKAGQTEPLQKWSYVKAVQIDGTPAYVGAGFYQE